MKQDEKRASQRIPIQVPVYIGNKKSVTRDVSSAGIFFLTDHLFAEGSNFDFLLDLAYALPGKPVRLGCQGEVVRVEPHNGKLGVAARIKNFQSVN